MNMPGSMTVEVHGISPLEGALPALVLVDDAEAEARIRFQQAANATLLTAPPDFARSARQAEQSIQDFARALRRTPARAPSGLTPIRRPPAISRNSKCPCGSGKKAKKCCQPIAVAIVESRTRRVANSAVRRGIGRIQAAGGSLESAVLVERPELLPVEAGEVRTVRPEIEAVPQ